MRVRVANMTIAMKPLKLVSNSEYFKSENIFFSYFIFRVQNSVSIVSQFDLVKTSDLHGLHEVTSRNFSTVPNS